MFVDVVFGLVLGGWFYLVGGVCFPLYGFLMVITDVVCCGLLDVLLVGWVWVFGGLSFFIGGLCVLFVVLRYYTVVWGLFGVVGGGGGVCWCVVW